MAPNLSKLKVLNNFNKDTKVFAILSSGAIGYWLYAIATSQNGKK